MTSIIGMSWRTRPPWSLAGSGRVAAMLLVLNLCAICPAAAQSSVAHGYRIGAGDKIGVVVLGQPDLSGEATVDQVGNLRLPVVGDIPAANLTLSELERSIGRSLEQGYVRRPAVSAKITEFRPIYLMGMVRTPGLYPYHQGQSVLAAMARAGGMGTPEQSGMDSFQADERVRLLEISRAALLAKQARLIAQQQRADRIDFPDMAGLAVDPARITQIRDSEQRAFATERQAEQQETEALRKQFPRLDAEIASLKEQSELEQRQRGLNQQLIADYEQLAKSGLARKPTYIEIKREEARIEGNIARLKSETLKAELAIGDLQFRITELGNNYQRRVMAELRETERSLLELTVTLPSSHRARAARGPQLLGEPSQQPAITVIRSKGSATIKYEAGLDFLLEPGDVVLVGSPLSPAPPSPVNIPSEKTAETKASSQASDSPASVATAVAPVRTRQ